MATDMAVRWVYRAVQEAGYILMITVDHRNVEQMKDIEKDMPFTEAVTVVVLVKAIADKVMSCPFSLAIAYGC